MTASAPTVQIQPLPNTPSATKLLAVGHEDLISQAWNQWLLQAQQKINVINETLAIISGIQLTSDGAIPVSSGGTGATTAEGAFNDLSPLTTNGDMLVYNGGNVRLPKGADGTTLVIDNSTHLPAWLATAGGGYGLLSLQGGNLPTTYDDKIQGMILPLTGTHDQYNCGTL